MAPDDPQLLPGRPLDEPLERALAWRRLSAAMFADAAPPGPPSLGEFQVLGVLGRGAMGTVYLAHDPALAREVAIKVLHERDAAARERLVREAQAIARVGHPALVAVHAIGEHAGQIHVVMERVRGESLRAWQEQPDRPWRELLATYLQVGRGLQALHDAGLVHRDIKPENVLVEADGRARIVDLGLARGIDAHAADVAGTPLYMAPEQRAGAAVPASDQFALCFALFEAVYRRRPFADATAVELAAAVATGALVTPAPGDIPERIRGALARGLQADPARRWPSMRALVDALEQASATTRGQRDRQILLARTTATWIDGVLERTLAGAVPLRPTVCTAAESSAGRTAEDLSGLVDGGRSLVIVGAPGAGKTTLLLTLARDAIRRAHADPTRPLPVVLHLGSWSIGPLAEWVVDELRDKLGIPRRLTRGWLRDDGLLVLLDGLDRVAPRLRPACIAAILEFRRTHPVPVLVTCRDDVHAAQAHPLGLDTTVLLQPLDPERIRGQLAHDGPAHDGLLAALAADPTLRDTLRTPLLVDIAARTFVGRPAAELVNAGSSAAIKHELWSGYLRRMSEGRGDASADLAHLAFIAARMEQERRCELYVEQIQPTWLESQVLRSLHAGLTLLAVGGAAAALVGVAIGLAGGVPVGLTTALLVGPTLALFIGLAVGVRTIRPVERLAWSAAELRRGARGAVLRGLALALLVATIATVAWSVGGSASFAVQVFVTNLIVYGLLFSLVLAVVAGIRGEAAEHRLAPNQGIRTSARNAAVVADAVAVATAVPLLALTLGFGPPPAPPLDTPEALEATRLWRANPLAFFVLIELCIAVTLGLFAGMHRGGLVVVSHGVLRLLLAVTGRLPLRLVRMLDRASSRALLRKTGGGYMFVHDELREHLAGMHNGGGPRRV
jgi:predicted Ser/Thr protein kinase